jgi:hypothetical protein
MVQDLSSFQPIEMAVFSATGFSGGSAYNVLNGASSYQYYTGNGFQYDIKVLKMYNGTTVPIVLSYQQIVSGGAVVNVRNDYIPVGGTFVLDLQTNHADNASNGAGTLNGRQGQLIWGNAAAGTGNLYIIGFR